MSNMLQPRISLLWHVAYFIYCILLLIVFIIEKLFNWVEWQNDSRALLDEHMTSSFTLKSYLHILVWLVLFIHLHCFDMNCAVLEMATEEMFVLNVKELMLRSCSSVLFQRLWHRQSKLSAGILWAVSCKNSSFKTPPASHVTVYRQREAHICDNVATHTKSPDR